jgi:hypothetical protein
MSVSRLLDKEIENLPMQHAEEVRELEEAAAAGAGK